MTESNFRKPNKYVLLANRFDHEAGTTVYAATCYDYGLANDDTMWTGRLHISVSLHPTGNHPLITVPFSDLKQVE